MALIELRLHSAADGLTVISKLMTGRESLTCLSGGLITGKLGVGVGVRLRSFLFVFRRIGRSHATHTVASADDVERILPTRVDAGRMI